MNSMLVALFKKEVEKTFYFLISEHKMRGPQLEIDERLGFAQITYFGHNLAIELILDERDEDLTCKISKLIANKIALPYAYDDNGVLVRAPLFDILKKRGLTHNPFTNVAGMSFLAQLPITLADFAQMLKMHGQDILADSPLLFK